MEQLRQILKEYDELIEIQRIHREKRKMESSIQELKSLVKSNNLYGAMKI